MNIYDFINSKDIKEYLKKINYEFTPVETAWLIWQSIRPLEEKHKAWQEIIDTMPDVPVKRKYDNLPSLHEFLKDYMQFELDVIDRFYNPTYECAFYQYSITGWYNGQYYRSDCEGFFSDFCSCYEEALSEIDELENPIMEITMNNKNNKIKIAYIADWSSLLKILDSGELTAEESDIDDTFFDMWFLIPVPFKKGDIVIPTRNSHLGFRKFCNYNPFVFISSSYSKYKENDRRGYDYSDMYAWGYSQYEDGQLNDDHTMFNYMDLEYYTGNLTGDKRILKAFSSCLKKKIDAGLFAMAYHQILMERYAANAQITDVTDDYLKLAGLEEK